jgi:hypothetical protein
MINIARRIERVEQSLGLKARPYPHVIVTTVRFDDDERPLELAPNVYLEVIGRPLTDGEIEEIRADWKQTHDEFEPTT